MNKLLFPLILLALLFNISLTAQEKVQIPMTSLTITLTDGYELFGSSPTISNKDFGIAFMEMRGVKFSEQVGGFDNIEEDYAQKGVDVQNQERGKLGKYDALFMTINSDPPLYQIFFGDDNFCAMANIGANDPKMKIDETKIKEVLSSIAYVENGNTAVDEQAGFIMMEEDKNWRFKSYMSNTFAFDSNENEDMIMITQLPSRGMKAEKKEMANQFTDNFSAEFPDLKVMEEGDWNTNKLNGYRSIIDLHGSGKMELLFMYSFNNDNLIFVFQGIGKENNVDTIKQYELFLNNLNVK